MDCAGPDVPIEPGDELWTRQCAATTRKGKPCKLYVEWAACDRVAIDNLDVAPPPGVPPWATLLASYRVACEEHAVMRYCRVHEGLA